MKELPDCNDNMVRKGDIVAIAIMSVGGEEHYVKSSRYCYRVKEVGPGARLCIVSTNSKKINADVEISSGKVRKLGPEELI